MHRFRWTLLALGFLVTSSTVAATQSGENLTPDAGVPAFAVAPAGEAEGAYFAATMESGTQMRMTAALVNASEADFHARTFAADAYTIVNGGMGVEEDESGRSGVTSWIDYPAETLTIDPRSTVERPFTVSVPVGTPPGQYLTGIVLQTAEPIPVPGTTSLNQVLRKSVAVFITVPGQLSPGLQIGTVSIRRDGPLSTLVVEIENTGNALIRPVGTISVRDEGDATVLNAPVQMGPVYAGHATTIELSMDGRLPPGTHTVDVLLTDPSLESNVFATQQITVAPDEAPEALPEVAIDGVALVASPSLQDVQYLDVSITVVNNGESISGARVVLHVARDGESIEDFSLASSLALPTGGTTIEQRYVALGGWTTGVYSFGLTLERVDTSTGLAVIVGRTTVTETIIVP